VVKCEWEVNVPGQRFPRDCGEPATEKWSIVERHRKPGYQNDFHFCAMHGQHNTLRARPTAPAWFWEVRDLGTTNATPGEKP